MDGLRAVDGRPDLDVCACWRCERHRQQFRAVLHRLREHQHPVVDRVDVSNGVSTNPTTLSKREIEWCICFDVVRIARRGKVYAADTVVDVRECFVHSPQCRTECVADSYNSAA